jgi:hypothetical protein
MSAQGNALGTLALESFQPSSHDDELVRIVFRTRTSYKDSVPDVDSGNDKTGLANVAAARRDGKTIIFAINKTTPSIAYELTMDGIPHVQTLRHQASELEKSNA